MNSKLARLIAAAALLLPLGAGAFAHRLDEYLQAMVISVEKDRLQVLVRLIPGVAVSSQVLASIDTDGDGLISQAEQQAYAQQVLGDLSITVDGHSVRPTLVSLKFPAIEEIKEGLGEIQIEFNVALPPGSPERRIVFEDHHHNEMSAYLVNCLVPRDPNIRILAQTRNETQSFYQLDYVLASNSSVLMSWNRWSSTNPGSHLHSAIPLQWR